MGWAPTPVEQVEDETVAVEEERRSARDEYLARLGGVGNSAKTTGRGPEVLIDGLPHFS